LGLDADTEKDALASDIQRVSNYMTINEIRAKHSLDKIDGGDVILNQAYITALGMSQQQAQEQGQGNDDYEQEEGQEESGEDENQEPEPANEEEQQETEPTNEEEQQKEVGLTKALKKSFTIEI
jgi:cell division ATPase FtsA